MRVMLCLGDFVFSPAKNTEYEKLSRHFKSGWQAQERMGQKPVKQLVSLPLETLTLSGTWFQASGIEALNTLRSMMTTPHTLTNNAGDNLGRWTIENVEENQEIILSDGEPMKVQFSIQLEEYS
ncbi:hypothetical protein CAY59_20740 [Vibrio campbellii]|uniref:phage tail protein n=1 Tax=Vibrio campbellii TaxID=680 RepID=UPI000A2FC23D|nr:phage tail protein [Vibrio campbellii]ARR46675.1 hypothetical protein CAY59_20740 [Vibrio campbellii]